MKNEMSLRQFLHRVPFVKEWPYSSAEYTVATPLVSDFDFLRGLLASIGLRWQRQSCGGIAVDWLDGPESLQLVVLSHDELASSCAAGHTFSTSLLLRGTDSPVVLYVYPQVGVIFGVECLNPHEVRELHRCVIDVALLGHIRRYPEGEQIWVSYDSTGQGSEDLRRIASDSWVYDPGTMQLDLLVSLTSVCQQIALADDCRWRVYSTHAPNYSVLLPVYAQRQ